MAQRVMIHNVIVTQRYAKHPLSDQGANAVLDQFLTASILKTICKPINQANRPVGCP